MSIPIRIYISRGLLILSLSVLHFSCQNKQSDSEIDIEKLKEPLIKVNKTAAEIESEQIEAYIKRRGWNMVKTGTGLRYMVYRQGTGPVATKGQTAKINFEISLLNGKVCYNTNESGPHEFLIGQSEAESGLHEGITYMRAGDKAKLILPSHLAHGLAGDMDKIPPRSTIIYDIELLALK